MAEFEQEHYLGAGPLCGAQLRYLIASPQGYLGGLAFSAAAWRLAPRDRWLGWSDVVRAENLHLVVNQSRFLIRAYLQAPNLASHSLALALQRLSADWQAIGLTQGRGRQDTTHQAQRGQKIIWVKPLQPDFRAVLRAAPSQPRLARPAPAAIPPPPPPLPVDWAENEFGAVTLGDGRLRTRLLTLARDFYASPTASLAECCGGSWAEYRAACRFMDHPRTGLNALLASHYQATAHRVAQESVVLAVQDTTSLNYSAHPATALLGPIGTEPDGAQGLLVHDTMAFTVEGTPLGLLDVQCWGRDSHAAGQKHQRRQRPFEQKESFKWQRSAQAVAALRSACPQTLLVSVGDREADIYELFAWAQAEPGAPKLLVRAAQDRCVTGEQGHLWAQVEAQVVEAGLVVHVPRRATQSARTARLEVRHCAVVEEHEWKALVAFTTQCAEPPPTSSSLWGGDVPSVGGAAIGPARASGVQQS